MEKIILQGLPPEVSEYISKLEAQVEHLSEIVRVLQKARFGQSSEKARYILKDGVTQVSFFNEAEACADEAAPEPEITVAPHVRKKKRTKEELTKTLPVEEVVIDLPEDERKCNICEGDLHPIGRELVRRELNVIPSRVYITEIYSVTYGCGDCVKESDEANIIKAPVPEPVVKRGLASPSSAAYTVYQKYVNHMPLYRQEADWANHGVKISRATLANWVIYVCLNWLTPLYILMKSLLLESPVIHADESVVQVLKEDGKTPQSESRMWAYCSGNTGAPPIVLFEYQPDRAGIHPKEFLAGFTGFLVTDGYSGYNAVPGVTHCGCWAHQRRKYEEALPKTDKKGSPAAEGLAYCQKLFALEREFEKLSPEERLKQRQERSKPVLDAYFAWVDKTCPLAGSKLAQAITYARNQEKPLRAFLSDGRIEISNNRMENAIRPFTVGRKNYLFCDTVRGAQASAVAYSITETAKVNGLNPYQYLLRLFTELPTVLAKDPEADLTRFLPWSVSAKP